MTQNEKLLTTLEDALIIWSRRWGFAMSEHSLKEAESQIMKIQRQLDQMKDYKPCLYCDEPVNAEIWEDELKRCRDCSDDYWEDNQEKPRATK